MKTIEFFKRKGYNPAVDTIGGEVMMDGICVGEWNGRINYVLFKGGDDSEHYGQKHFDSLEECAKWLVECGRYDSDYEEYSGAFRYYFNTKTGYDHISNYLKHFPLIKKYTIKVEAIG